MIFLLKLAVMLKKIDAGDVLNQQMVIELIQMLKEVGKELL